MNKTIKLLGVVGAAGVVAAGGSAFTTSNTVGGLNVAGYGTASVTGATTTGIEHTLSADGTTIVSTLLTFSTDLVTTDAVGAGFGTTNLVDCVEDFTANTAVCTYTAGNNTQLANDFHVAVS